MNHCFAQCVHTVDVSRPVVTVSVVRSTASVSQCLHLSNPGFTYLWPQRARVGMLAILVCHKVLPLHEEVCTYKKNIVYIGFSTIIVLGIH